MLLRVNWTKEPEILLRDISDGHVLSLVQSFHADEFDRARGTLFLIFVALANRSKACKIVLSATPCILEEGASVIPMDRRHHLQELRELQMAGEVT